MAEYNCQSIGEGHSLPAQGRQACPGGGCMQLTAHAMSTSTTPDIFRNIASHLLTCAQTAAVWNNMRAPLGTSCVCRTACSALLMVAARATLRHATQRIFTRHATAFSRGRLSDHDQRPASWYT